jgi:hypothetical protein
MDLNLYSLYTCPWRVQWCLRIFIMRNLTEAPWVDTPHHHTPLEILYLPPLQSISLYFCSQLFCSLERGQAVWAGWYRPDGVWKEICCGRQKGCKPWALSSSRYVGIFYVFLLCWISKAWISYSRVSFYDGSFCDVSLLRPLSSRTEHSLLVVHHCRNSSVLSLLKCASSSFPVCMCFFLFYFSAVLISWLWFFHPWRPSERHKRRKRQNIWRYILSWGLLNHCLGLLQQNKKWFVWYFVSIICVIFYIPNSLN